MTTQVLIVNFGEQEVYVDRTAGMDSQRLIKLYPRDHYKTYVYEGCDIRITEVRKDNEVSQS